MITNLEKIVLKQLFNDSATNRHDFACTDEIQLEGELTSRRMIPGIVSSLSKRGLFDLYKTNINGKLTVQIVFKDIELVKTLI